VALKLISAVANVLNGIAATVIKDTVLTMFVLKCVKLVVSVRQGSPVTLSLIFVYPRTNVTLGQLYQNVMLTKYGMSVVANVPNVFVATPIKDIV